MCKTYKTRVFWVVNILHVGLPHVLDLAVRLVHLQTWVGRGGHTETLGYLATPTSKKLLVVDNLLPDHVELPLVLDLAGHLVHLNG